MKTKKQTYDVSNMAYWDALETSDAFLMALKANNITLTKLKSIVFGNTAIKVIRAIKTSRKDFFNDIVKSHQIWWTTKYAICQAINSGSL